MTYGPTPGVPIGSSFTSRESLYHSGVHRDLRNKISIGAESAQGAESVLFSPALEGDDEVGNMLYCSGMGYRKTGLVASPQFLEGANAYLSQNVDSGQAVRVVQHVESRFIYLGLYQVDGRILRIGQLGYGYYSFRLRRSRVDLNLQIDQAVNGPVVRVFGKLTRIVRDPSVPARVKSLYDFRCQICGETVLTASGPYSEGAHLLPLGGESGGPDVVENVLSLCPNHHVMLDHGGLYFDKNWRVIDLSGKVLGALKIHPDHGLDTSFAARHRALFGF